MTVQRERRDNFGAFLCVFFLLCFKREMADAGVGVFVWRMKNCGILALVYMGEGEGWD